VEEGSIQTARRTPIENAALAASAYLRVSSGGDRGRSARQKARVGPISIAAI
jgi:hypothetical protein